MASQFKCPLLPGRLRPAMAAAEIQETIVEKDDVASFNLRGFCRKLLIISKQQHQIETPPRRCHGQCMARQEKKNGALILREINCELH